MKLIPRSWTRDHHGRQSPEPQHSSGISRRQVLGAAAGLVVGAGLSTSAGAQDRNPHIDESPLPIPGGVSPFGILIHHFPVIANSTPLSALSEPSQITDFNGFVGLTAFGGLDRALASGRSRSRRTWASWTACTSPRTASIITGRSASSDWTSSPVQLDRTRFTTTHIDSNGVFWTMAVPRKSVDVHFGSGRAAFQLTTQTFDDHDLLSSLTGSFPAGFPQIAEITFNVEWSGILNRQHVRNEAQDFDGDFMQTGSDRVVGGEPLVRRPVHVRAGQSREGSRRRHRPRAQRGILQIMTRLAWARCSGPRPIVHELAFSG
jgi:hypothetical protein